jgi:hypothetical protein
VTIQPGPFEQQSPFEQPSQFSQPAANDPSPAIKRSLNPTVGQVSPALYAAGARTNLTREERNLIENWSSIKGTHEKLMAMNNKKAAEQFKKLNPEDQAILQAYYKVDYENKSSKDLIVEDPAKRKLLGLDNGLSVGDVFKSPFRFIFAAANQYTRAYNAPWTMAQESITNREDFWTRSNFEMSFDGKFSYDDKLADELVKKHGKELSFAAMHLLAGETPGQIIDAWGPNDGAILEAVNKVFNEPDKISEIMDEFDRARLSPGRAVARWVNKTFDISAEKHPDWFKNGSGLIDLAFQIFADPLTYLTAGSSNIFKAQKLTKALVSSRDVVAHFADPKVIKYFEGYGERIGEYKKASDAGNASEAAKLKEGIQSRYKDHGTDAEIKLWAEKGVTDFTSFKAEFTDNSKQEFSRLIQGRVVGASFAKEAAVYARPTRELTLKGKEKVKEVFRGKAAFDQLGEVGTQKLLKDVAESNFSDVEKVIQETAGKGVKKLLKQLEYQASLHPGSTGVFTNEKYIDTIETLRQQANLVFKDKALSHLFAEHYISSNQAERITLKRNLDHLTLRSTGLHGLPGGQKYIDEVLDGIYGGDGFFGVTDKLVYPPQSGIQGLDDSIRGPIEPSQLKDAISALPWREISETVANIQLKYDKKLDVRTASNLIGGAYNSKVLGDFIDNWSILTLFPQLGFRSSIDEGFFFTLTAKFGTINEFRKAQKYGKAFAAAKGSTESTGPVKDIAHIAMGRLTGKNVGPARSITQGQRNEVNARIDEAVNTGVIGSRYEGVQLANREFLALGLKKYGDNIDDVERGYLQDLGEYSPQFLADTTSLKIIDATMNKQNIRGDRLISKANSDKSLEEAALTATGKFRVENLKNMPEETIEATMFYNFITRFNQNGFKIGGEKNLAADPARLFIANNGLRTKQDWDNATNQFLEAVGFRFRDGVWDVSNKKLGDIQRFINSSTHFAKFDGMSDVDKVRGFIQDTYTNLYAAFHGDGLQFNEDLIKVFEPFIKGYVKDHRQIVNQITRNEDVLHPSGMVKIPSYSKLVKNNKPTENIVTDLTDIKLGYAGNYRKLRDRAYEGMSRTQDDMYRAPAVQAHYVLSRKKSAIEEAGYAKELTQKAINEGVDPVIAAASGKAIAKEFFTNRAITDATNRVLKYADNPDIRTVFSYNVRTVGRFYRAVEDFHRRMYRLVKDNKLSTIYRARLMSQGMDSLGDVHTDPNGEKYVVLPMDDIIYGAVDGTLRMLTGNEAQVHQPLFNDITFNLTAGNPSFQTDAGVPYLSGPAGSISILAVKSLLGNFSTTANAAEDLDQWTLGSMGDNVTLKGSLTPKFVNTVWKMLSPDERNQQEVSAYTQALAYNQANDLGIDPTDKKYVDPKTGLVNQALLDEDKRKYLDVVKVSAHNIIVTRALLGMILPFSVQTKDTKDLPSYLKDNGVVSMKSSFFEVLDQMKLKYPEVDNHYELALATWMGENPGKVAYVVSTNQEAVKPIIRYSNEMQNWAITNADAIKKYGNGALMFAPNTGEFTPGVYKWAEAAGLTSKLPGDKTTRQYIEAYYQDLMLKEYANAYYDINAKEEEELRNIPFTNVDLRRASLQAYEDWRKEYKIGVPGLEEYIASGKDNGDASDFIQSAYNYVNSTGADVKPDVKQKINEAYTIFNDFIEYANYINSLDPSGGADLKRAKKTEAQDKIQKLINSDSSKTVEQYYKYGLLKMMNSKSRDAQPGVNRNVIKKVGN